ncbi:NAD-dependent epimerase/dehydratase family protein [Thalassobaculum sp. OXR-137]|uniref:NAD-dependent epimerase/dehydratase family protein n=1 Tax=Thalassobaculum sp. OXR-137 TaxID=3100173 RepID=UPI002AC95A93|nr:NAD-dependent epimerase/dehydratase family protein [Thalassobaculum sp. OXR-137]WPZ35229.1 NAD-dependent epimerase/dehydratase family protein [Thalassobaculum sp. OXR-137]
MTVLVTGAAGFIGMHTVRALLDRGERVIGIDNLNAYYDPALKHARLAELQGRNGFSFERIDFSDRAELAEFDDRHPEIDRIVHLGAQAGVRYSLQEPFDYASANLVGHLSMLEMARGRMAPTDGRPALKHFVYASSSSVYGANREVPFSIDDRTDRPVSFYGATKKANEVMTYSYASLYGIPATGLRFFTVYGPWGRPDMSPWLFAERILRGDPIQVFNHGQMRRDFTYIDDIVAGVIAALDRPPAPGEGEAPHAVYNLGNNRPVALLDYIRVLEAACGRSAHLDMKPMQPGDVPETYADIDASIRDLGFCPTTSIEEGIPRFIDWFKRYHGM